MAYIATNWAAKAFTCPHCGVVSRYIKWGYSANQPSGPSSEDNIHNMPVKIGRCEHCNANCIWFNEQLVYPDKSNAPTANPDMPPEIKADYTEAALIVNKSPRGAAALLRLAIQKLIVHLGGTGQNLNDDIAALVKKGLPVQVQQALDVVRVIGNSAVHPGQIDTNDAEVAAQLFPLINVIVEYQISLPSRINDLYSSLPEGARAAISKRDGNATS